MLELTKPRITQLVLLTAAAGFYLGARDHVNLALLVNTLIGTALVAGGTNAWNQIRERDVDARMVRTRRRPLPSGRLTTAAAIWFATAITVVGVGYLAVMVNLLTALLAALTFASYVLLYTPLKRKTSLNTLVGAVPGALPIVGGWTAAGGSLGVAVVALFWILFLWQLPHFLALAWLYRDDYRASGLRMLTGRRDRRLVLLRRAGPRPRLRCRGYRIALRRDTGARVAPLFRLDPVPAGLVDADGARQGRGVTTP